MLSPGTRVVLVLDGEIVTRGDLYVVFAYVDTYTVVGSDDEGETAFGIFDAECVEPYHAPPGPAGDLRPD